MIEITLVLLKPDAIQRCISGEIISRFEKVGLKIIGIKMQSVNEQLAEKHYKEHITKNFFPKLKKMIMESPVISIALQGSNAVEVVRKMAGGTEPKSALPGTIRGDYGHISYEQSMQKNIAVKNLIHASDSKKSAERELKLWFDESELYNYSTVHEIHTI